MLAATTVPKLPHLDIAPDFHVKKEGRCLLSHYQITHPA
jgi:hypothetical protein